jgi:hypothetical protein
MAKYEIKDGVGIIPDGTTEIEESAFKGCEDLVSVTIPDSVTVIGESAFKGCTGLTSIVIPDSVTEIGKLAFWNCTSLKSASLLGPVKSLEATFHICNSLETITLGTGIKSTPGARYVDEDSHWGYAVGWGHCPALKTINVPAKKTDYYKKRIPEWLHALIVELPAEKKAK